MTFLAPLSGIIAAGIALPALVLLYFLKLRRRPVRVSSTLLWARAIRDLEVNVPFRWLRMSWPLVVQFLAVTALALAIARPTLGPAGGAGRRVIVLIDHSASMSALDGRPAPSAPRSRLDEAKVRAIEFLESLDRAAPTSDVLVAQFAHAAQTLTPMSASTRAAREAIESIEPTDQPGDLAAAVRLLAPFARPAAEESPGDAPIVHLFSDGCNPTPPEGRTVVHGLDLRVHRVGPPPSGAPAAAAATGTPSLWNNLGIAALNARRDYDDPATLRLFVRVVSASDRPARAAIRVQLGAEDVGSVGLDIPPAFTRPDGSVTAGEATATVSLTNTTGGILVASLPGADLLAADDSAALILDAPARPHVMVVGPGSAGDRDADVDSLIRSCVRAHDLGRIEFLDAASAAARLATDEDRPDLVIYDRVRPAVLPPLPTISFGAGLPIPGFTVSPRPDAAPTRIISWDRAHALLRFVSLDSVVVDPPLAMAFDPEVDPDAPPRRIAFSPLAEGAAGPLIALLDDAGVRRVVVAFALDRSNWGPTAPFPVFLAGAMDLLTLRAQAQSGRAFTTTDAIAVSPAPGAGSVSVSGPRSFQVAVPPGAQTVALGVLERAGLYACRGAAPSSMALAVNLASGEESLIRTRDDLGLSGRSTLAVGSARSTGGEIWAWFVLAAAALLSIEWFLLAWRMRL